MCGLARLGGRLALGLWLTFPGAAYAGTGVWTTGGPYGGTVAAVVVDPTNPATVYVGLGSGHVAVPHGAGIFKSTDSGSSWARSSLGTPAKWNVNCLVIQSAAPGALYAGGEGGIYRSTDVGASWASLNAGFPASTYPIFVDVLASSQTAVNTLYASVIYRKAQSSMSGVFKSTDAGATWTATTLQTSSGNGVRALAIHPTTPSTVFAAVSGLVYRSTDGGATWSPGDALPPDVRTLAVDPSNPTTVFAGTMTLAGVFKSTNSGATWAPASSGLTGGYVQTLAIPQASPSTLFAGTTQGAFKSTDSGGSWMPASAGLSDRPVQALAVDPTLPNKLYAGTFGGVFRSTDAGGLWAPTNAGLTGLWVTALVVDPTMPTTVYARTVGGGVFKSSDAGASWTATNAGPDDALLAGGALAIDPTNPSTLYAGTVYSGLLKSTDGGGTWVLTGQGLRVAGIFFSLLVVDPATPSTLYAAPDDYVFKSTDAGATWADTGLMARSLVIDASAPATLYAGVLGLSKSTDAGASWAATGLTSPAPISALFVDPGNPATLYAGSGAAFPYLPYGCSGVFKTTDAGASWVSVNTGLPGESQSCVRALALGPATSGTLYAAADLPDSQVYHPGLGSGVSTSADSGGTWALVNAGLPPHPSVRALALAPSAPPTLYAGLEGGSVWQASPPPPAFAKGDLDADGTPDLVFRGATDGARNKVWFMNGVARTSETTITPDAPSAAWRIRGVDDFDGDGRNDLAFWNDLSGQVEFWLMNGAARVGPAVPLGGAPVLSRNWELAATADFDHDTLPDIVWRNATSQKIVIWAMNGPAKWGAITPTPSQAVDGNWAIAGARDYNHDGNTDFLWYNATSGKLVTWYMDASVVRTSGQFTSPPNAGDNNWKVVASADYSGASGPGTPPLGSPDIVWRNETSGNQVVWHMDFASTRVHGEFTNPPANSPALDWTIVGPR